MVPTLVFPSSTGGGTFAGATYDPNLNYIFVNDKDLGTIAMLTPQLSSNKFESLAKSKIPFIDQNGYPCSTPPWGELMAINAATGDIVWREPLGEIKELTAKHGSPRPLEGVSTGGRLGVLYSQDGLNDTAHTQGCCCCGGNEIYGAAKVNVNILAYALAY